VRKLHALEQYLDAPSSFNTTEFWLECMGEIRNQGQCGAGWAFAIADLVSCSPAVNFGCEGGYIDYSWYLMPKVGLPEETCLPYVSGDNDESGLCNANCATFYKATNIVCNPIPVSHGGYPRQCRPYHDSILHILRLPKPHHRELR
jgi:hypothetical protein